jgi:hypothetical protein
VLRFDPLDFDPSRLSWGSDPPTAAAASAGSIDDPQSDAIEGVAAAAADDAAEDVLPVVAPRDVTLHVRLGPMPSEPPRRDAAFGMLAMRVESFGVADVPLVELVDTIAGIAGTPITVRPSALELGGISPRAAVSVQANDATLENVLGDVLARHRLALVDREGRIEVALANGERWRAVDYEVEDLVGASDARRLAKLIKRIVAPESWDVAGGKATIVVQGTKLRIEQLQAVHHETLIFCERLRLARGLRPRSRYPAERLSIDPAHAAIASKLNAPTTFTFLPWARLRDVARHWQEASGVTILVDWSALAKEELGPSTPIACSSIARPWHEALEGILKPLGLAWWAVDGATIQITSRRAADAIQRLEFYDVPDSFLNKFAGAAAVVEALEAEWGQRAGAAGLEPRISRMEFDEPSGRLIVVAAPAAHRYLSNRFRSQSE